VQLQELHQKTDLVAESTMPFLCHVLGSVLWNEEIAKCLLVDRRGTGYSHAKYMQLSMSNPVKSEHFSQEYDM